MTLRYLPISGEGMDCEPVDWPCSDCGLIGCDCDDDYRSSPQELAAYMALPREEREARHAAALAHIEKVWAEKVEADLRFTIDQQKRRAA